MFQIIELEKVALVKISLKTSHQYDSTGGGGTNQLSASPMCHILLVAWMLQPSRSCMFTILSNQIYKKFIKRHRRKNELDTGLSYWTVLLRVVNMTKEQEVCFESSNRYNILAHPDRPNGLARKLSINCNFWQFFPDCLSILLSISVFNFLVFPTF